MIYKILLSDEISLDGLRELEKNEAEVVYKPEISGDELARIIGNFDALIVRGRTKVTRDILSAAKKLKVIGRAGVGTDNIDAEFAQKKGVRVINTPDALTESVAELTVGLMLTLARKIHFADKRLKEGEWLKQDLEGFELNGKTYGTIGIGRIGLRVSRLVKGFGMKIMAHDIIEINQEIIHELGLEIADVDLLLSKSDFVDLHVPLTPETHHMVNSEAISKMKPSAILINTSRGAVVDEKALLKALQEGRIGGAALDVFEVEPVDGKKFSTMTNVVCTPHIGGQTVEAQEKAGVMIARLVLEALSNA